MRPLSGILDPPIFVSLLFLLFGPCQIGPAAANHRRTCGSDAGLAAVGHGGAEARD